MSETPLIRQYLEIKDKHKDKILFFRVGDFYEMFFDDAKIASKVLEITLTSKSKEIPMAGVPYHSAPNYINRLIENGYKVAICEQLEDPKDVKGIVKRDVVKIITKGTTLDVENIDSKTNNYLLAIHGDKNKAVASYIDITTGEFKVRYVDIKGINTLIYKLDVKEILISTNIREYIESQIPNDILKNTVSKVKNSEEFLKDYFNVYSLDIFNLTDKLMIETVAIIVDYLIELQIKKEININRVIVENEEDYTYLNVNTIKNLDILKNQKDGKKYGSLLWILDECKTSMGSRLLRSYVNNPLLNKEEIEKRLNDVEYLKNDFILREDIVEILKDISDIERIMTKVIFGNSNGKDLNALKYSFKNILKISKLLENKYTEEEILNLKNLYQIIDDSIDENAPFSIREGNIIKSGYNLELDEYRSLMNDGTAYLLNLEQKERERTGIKSLKIKYNKIFGYFIELSRTIDNLPEDYIIKQTLANNQRYITEELKNYEYKILNAKNKVESLEYDLFKEINNKIKSEYKIISNIANKTSYIDVICSFSKVATDNNYIRPNFSNEYEIKIKDGRHPIVEKLIKDKFTPNDILIDENKNFIILTGPNMAGKSTYMKQIALISLMAQIGSFVPASSAELSIVDKILTRIGASDDILSGQSTFMVEMTEVSNILNNATKNSLIILDEVGRGTSTTDGLSIAISICKYMNDNISAKTIFATHYHELTELENELEKVVNYNVDVYENNSKIIFTHNIVKGSAKKSYGIEVAKLAGLPNKILKNSYKILKEIENNYHKTEMNLFTMLNEDEKEEDKLMDIKIEKLENLEKFIEEIDINNTTPLEALKKLYELKEIK